MSSQEFELSQRRWRADEPYVGLTWGVRKDGVGFLNFICTHTHTEATDTVVEIGPGYGRITEALIQQHMPFGRYVGLELSAARVNKLRHTFSKEKRCEFKQADILSLGKLDIDAVALTFGSAVFEHLYPDFGEALNVIWQFTKPDGMLVFDLIRWDDELQSSHAEFQRDDDTYFRVYALSEVERLLSGNGFLLQAFEPQSLGPDWSGHEVKRVIFACQKI